MAAKTKAARKKTAKRKRPLRGPEKQTEVFQTVTAACAKTGVSTKAMKLLMAICPEHFRSSRVYWNEVPPATKELALIASGVQGYETKEDLEKEKIREQILTIRDSREIKRGLYFEKKSVVEWVSGALLKQKQVFMSFAKSLGPKGAGLDATALTALVEKEIPKLCIEMQKVGEKLSKRG